MTTEELVDMLVELLESEVNDAEAGRIADEDCIGLNIGDQTWFIEVKEG